MHDRLLLVIDDEPLIQAALKRAIRGAGWDYLGAQDGVDGLEIAGEFRPDLIILDVNMPEMDGRDVLQALKQHPALKEVPVIVITARNDEYTRMTALEAGAHDVVEKPFDPAMLMRKVAWTLEKEERARAC